MNSDSPFNIRISDPIRQNPRFEPILTPASNVGPLNMACRALFLLLCFLSPLSGGEIDGLMRAASAAEKRQDSRQALDLLLKADRIRPNDALILQKIARQYSDLVVDQPGNEGKRNFAEIALNYSERAVVLNPRDAVNVLSLAICHGKLALYSDTKDKVRYSRLVLEECQHALELDPNYAWAHHVLGRWHCEMATLGGTARFFAKLFYGELPPASLEDGIHELQRATELDPAELNHWLELGFAYAAANQPQKATKAWTRGLSLPSRGPHDEFAKGRARKAMAGLN